MSSDYQSTSYIFERSFVSVAEMFWVFAPLITKWWCWNVVRECNLAFVSHTFQVHFLHRWATAQCIVPRPCTWTENISYKAEEKWQPSLVVLRQNAQSLHRASNPLPNVNGALLACSFTGDVIVDSRSLPHPFVVSSLIYITFPRTIIAIFVDSIAVILPLMEGAEVNITFEKCEYAVTWHLIIAPNSIITRAFTKRRLCPQVNTHTVLWISIICFKLSRVWWSFSTRHQLEARKRKTF